MKTRFVRILIPLVLLVALGGAAYGAAVWLSRPNAYEFQKGAGLPKDKIIQGTGRSVDFGVHKGDAFTYIVEVQYDPSQVLEIDRSSLDKSIDFKPFEIRDSREADYVVNERTRAYRKEYELQFIEGKLDQAYTFPSLVVRYKLKDSGGYADKAVDLGPVYAASRLPEDVEQLELRMLTEKLEDPSRRYVPWVLWSVGGLLILAGAVNLAWRTIPQWRQAAAGARKRTEQDDVIAQAYRSLLNNAKRDGEPRQVFQQTDRLLRLVLARKENISWLDEPNLNGISPQIRETVLSLFEATQQMNNGAVSKDGIQPTLDQLQSVLGYYYGAGEIKAWRT